VTHSSTPTLVIATRNQGKAKEIRKILGNVPWQLLSLEEFNNVGDAPENEDSYAGNALAKAEFYAAATQAWVLADDSGLEVSALGGAPGVFSARYAGPNASDAERRSKLLDELRSFREPYRKARFVCIAAVVKPNREVVKVTEGICVGSIVEAPRGVSGFGYDPIFKPDGFNQTFGELPDKIKNQISHRARALFGIRNLLWKQPPLDRVNFGS
jgi:XTP/dITP diphosphohydrolase